ncbi:MAG: MBOAT family protein [Bacteroidales bacterium]|nr:MBOAT family protein [Bacteroidales bacterium]MCF8405337.1 MBOAT family protein [Bacteroidales bacterium]
MLFNSLEFIIFFPIVVAAYFALNPRYRWILLLFASYYFYMCWNYKYIVLIIFSTIIDYLAARGMYYSNTKVTKRIYLFGSLISNLGLLFFFKYFSFFGENMNVIFEKFNLFYHVPEYSFLLPVGISFYTFQTLSYTIDVYRGERPPERHLGKFALYVAFFPQLVAGPIERSSRLLPQFHKVYNFDYERVKNGIILMTWGFFKKVVIADRLSEYVNIVYNNPHDYGGFQELIATFFFGSQIYCDFSGYSDIAIGSAMILGYDLMTNFRRPYLSRSIREFWGRWHISLSTWFRDYLYIPLGGNRVVKWRWYYNLFITFLISGLWHGANWTFVIWGALHGFYLVLAIITAKQRDFLAGRVGLNRYKGINDFLNLSWTFVLVYFAWIFFRANSMQDAMLIIGNMLNFETYNLSVQLFHFRADFILSFVLIGVLIGVEVWQEKFRLIETLVSQPRIIKWAVYLLIIGSIMVLGKWDENDFLYFQF